MSSANPPVPVMPSSVVRAFWYHPREERLEILFQSGRRYSYHGVPQALTEAMRGAISKGEFFNSHIRDHFPFTREKAQRAS